MKKIILKLLIGVIFINLSAFSYPKEENQGPIDQLESGVVALDGINLLFFTIPEVIAFAVDFNKDTIYLPSASRKKAKLEDLKTEEMVAIAIDSRSFNNNTIQSIVSAEVGQNIDFSKLQAYKIDKKGNKIRVL